MSLQILTVIALSAEWKVHTRKEQHMARLRRWSLRLGSGACPGGELPAKMRARRRLRS